jgi:hypothetical protein
MLPAISVAGEIAPHPDRHLNAEFSGTVQVPVSLGAQSRKHRSRSSLLVNVLKSHPGMVYVAVLVMVVCALPLARETRHIRQMDGLPDHGQRIQSLAGWR